VRDIRPRRILPGRGQAESQVSNIPSATDERPGTSSAAHFCMRTYFPKLQVTLSSRSRQVAYNIAAGIIYYHALHQGICRVLITHYAKDSLGVINQIAAERSVPGNVLQSLERACAVVEKVEGNCTIIGSAGSGLKRSVGSVSENSLEVVVRIYAHPGAEVSTRVV
jgi:hypothetical protein